MSLLGMPWAILNLGCEMVYILHQRLHAQGIPPDKALQVLQDICCTMLEPSFFAAKLLVPQDMYSLASTRKIFDRLAHSSIMKLSQASMDKLFDLMVMGAKAQLFCSARLEDMLQVTLRHLGTVQALLAGAVADGHGAGGAADARAIDLLAAAEAAVLRLYSNLGAGELALLRCTLARFFQDKRVKVSLFLAEGVQLQSSGKLVAPSCLRDDVGLVRSFGDDGRLVAEERLALRSQQVDANEFFCHPLPLGDNLYRKDRPKVVPPPRAAEGTKAAPAEPPQLEEPSPAQDAGQAGRYEQPGSAGGAAGAAELDFLAALVQRARPASGDNFRLHLFDDGDAEAAAAAAAAAPPAGSLVAQQKQQRQQREQHKQALEFGSSGRNEAYIRAAHLGDVLEGEEAAADSKAPGEELLELLDGLGCQ